jgi:putative flippase GtrA
MAYKDKKIVVVMPAYNAAKTLVDCYNAIPKDFVDQIILVDDASLDNTVEVARTLPITVVQHMQNRGYGGNQKTCYKHALEHGADAVIMVHPDNQYDPAFVPEFVRMIVDDGHSVVFGSRMMHKQQALAGGMPKWKFVSNIVLTKIANFSLRTKLTEFHSGYRAYSREVLQNLDLENNSDDFIFDTEIIIQIVTRKFPIKEIAIPTKYFKEASQIKLWPSIKYGLGIIWNLFKFKSGMRNFSGLYDPQHLTGQFFRYLVAGTLAFAADFFSLYILVDLAHLHYLYAALMSFSCGLVTAFVLNRYWVFPYRKTDNLAKEFTVFTIIALLALAANEAAMWTFTEWANLHYLFSKTIVVAMFFVLNFVARRTFVFTTADESEINDPIKSHTENK